MLEQAYTIYNKEFEQLTLTAEEDKIDTYIEGLEENYVAFMHILN